MPLTFAASGTVVVDTIKFDQKFAGNQKLVIGFQNIQSVAFRRLHVDEALEVRMEGLSESYCIILVG